MRTVAELVWRVGSRRSRVAVGPNLAREGRFWEERKKGRVEAFAFRTFHATLHIGRATGAKGASLSSGGTLPQPAKRSVQNRRCLSTEPAPKVGSRDPRGHSPEEFDGRRAFPGQIAASFERLAFQDNPLAFQEVEREDRSNLSLDPG